MVLSKMRYSHIYVTAIILIALFLISAPAASEITDVTALPGNHDPDLSKVWTTGNAISSFKQTEQEGDYFTFYRINIAPDGSVVYRVENSVILFSKTSAEDWYDTHVHEWEGLLQQFSDEMNATVARASQQTGRAMEASDFKLSYWLAGSWLPSQTQWKGNIVYSFTWDGFANVYDGSIDVGDAFTDVFYLGQENLLYISPPVGFEVYSTSPVADTFSVNTAIWYGNVDMDPDLNMRIFEPGFPQVGMDRVAAVTTIPATATTTTQPALFGFNTNLFFGIIAGIVIVVAVAGVYVLRSRKSKRKVPAAEKSRPVVRPDDRELLLKILKQAGGQAYQSDLVMAMGYPDEKVNLIIEELQNDGMLVKIRRGNRNIIRILR